MKIEDGRLRDPGRKPNRIKDEGTGIRDLVLPDYPFQDDGDDLGRPTTTTINRVGPQSPKEVRINLAAINDTIPVVFGARRVQGKLFLWKDVANVWFLGWGFADGEANDITAIDIDDDTRAVSLTTNPQNVTGGRLYTGASGQDASGYVSGFIASYPDTLDEIVLFFSTIQADQLTGEPLAWMHMEGRKDLYDPRLDTGGAGDDPGNAAFQVYSVTPALCAAKMVQLASTSTNPLSINWSDVAAVADHNETLISGSPRHTVNITCDRDQDWRDWMDYFAFVGMFVWWEEAGEVRMAPDWVASPVMTVTADEIVPGSFKLVNGDPSYTERPDNTAVTYYDPASDQEVTVFAKTVTGNERTIDYRDSFGTDNNEEATRLAVTIQNRYEGEAIVAQFDMFDRGLLLEKWDLITLQFSPKGIDTEFRVSRSPQMIEPGIWRVMARIYNAASYDTSAVAGPTPNPITITPISTIPTGPTPTLVEVFSYSPPREFTFRVRITNPEWIHTKGFLFEVWNTGETEMLLEPKFILLGAMTVVSGTTLEAVFTVPTLFNFKVRTYVVNRLDETGDPGGFIQRTFAAGFEDPEVIPTVSLTVNPFGTSDPGPSTEDFEADHRLFVEWNDFPIDDDYPYVVDATVRLQTDGDGDQAGWSTIETQTVTDGENSAVMDLNPLKVYPPGGDLSLRPYGRVFVTFRNLFGQATSITSAPFRPDADPSDPIYNPSPEIDRVEIDPDDNQKALLFWNWRFDQFNINYAAVLRLGITDLTTSQFVYYYNVPAANSANPVPAVSPVLLNGSPLDPTSPFSHDPDDNATVKSFEFQTGRTYRFSLAIFDRDEVQIGSDTFDVTWDASVFGGLDSTVD